jgi:serine/threonine protein phosphatase PrpC
VTDEALLRVCAEAGADYSACTSVTAILSGDLLTCAHLGDSKIVLGRDVGGGQVVGKCLTMDHKPDQPEERKRIERAGGSLAYLHGGKPFIRGGDFTERQGKGDRPMQLNYSRAFGGKDLKMFGLLATPDIHQMQLTKADK